MRFNTLVAFGLFAAALVAAVTVACSDSPDCKPGTFALQVELAGTAAFADRIEVSSDTPGAEVMQTFPHDPNGPTLVNLDVAFPAGYPADKTVTLIVRASGATTLLGENVVTIHLLPKCSTAFVTIRSSTLDAFVAD
jgi:hypothetical protein